MPTRHPLVAGAKSDFPVTGSLHSLPQRETHTRACVLRVLLVLLAQNVTGNSGPSERQNWTLERTRTFHRPLRVLSPGGKQQCHRTQSVSKGARPKSPPSPAVIPGMRPPRGQPGFYVPSSRLCGSSSAICRTCPCIPPPLLTAQQWFRLGTVDCRGSQCWHRLAVRRLLEITA